MTVGALAPDPSVRATRRHRARRWIAAVSALVVVVALALALFLRLPYYTISPGSSRAVESLITVENATTYETDGQVDFLTVSLRQATAAELAYAWFDSAIEVKSKDDLFGKKVTESENHAINVRMMSDSKDAATYQALNRLGYTIPSSGTGAVVASVQDPSPAHGVLTAGDVEAAAKAGQGLAMASGARLTPLASESWSRVSPRSARNRRRLPATAAPISISAAGGSMTGTAAMGCRG